VIAAVKRPSVLQCFGIPSVGVDFKPWQATLGYCPALPTLRRSRAVETVIRRSITETLRDSLAWDEIWRGKDRGLIHCWENGRRAVGRNPELASAVRRGELPTLDWKGGIAGQPKMKRKYGSLCYLATWQGLREEDLCIDIAADVSVVCSRTGIKVVFTSDLSKLDVEVAEEGGE
jgi:hypothetical protein